MNWADTATIDALIARYHRNYLTYYAFFDDAGGDIGDHEEAVLLAQAEDSPICELMQQALPIGTPPERISAEVFYGDMYFWPKHTLVYGREKTTKRPMPWYLAVTGKAFKPDDYELLEAHWAALEVERGGNSEEEGRYGYSTVFQTEYDRQWQPAELNDCFHAIERFVCDDIHKCKIFDWRADQAVHCTEKHEYGACEGNYLWTVWCPVKLRLTVVRFHFNWFYA